MTESNNIISENIKQKGGGRPKGAPNKATVEFRETVRRLLEDNAENVSKWLSEVAATNPAKALDILANLAEYAAPKLSRVEVSGDKDNPLTIQAITRTVVDPLVINQTMPEKQEPQLIDVDTSLPDKMEPIRTITREPI